MTRLGWMVILTFGVSCTPAPPPIATTAQSDPSPPPIAVSSVAPVASAPTATATPAPSGSVATDASRDKKIQEKFGLHCRLERTCGALWGIDCEAASDGPYYYVKAETLDKVSECGGFCRGGRCTNCPPKEWSCATY